MSVCLSVHHKPVLCENGSNKDDTNYAIQHIMYFDSVDEFMFLYNGPYAASYGGERL